MRQNLVLSGAIILILIPLAAFGVLGLAAVVATHELAEILVIGNGVRAGRRPHSLPAALSVAPDVSESSTLVERTRVATPRPR